MVCTFHPSQFAPSSWCKPILLRWRCMSSYRTSPSFCTIAGAFHCVSWGSECRFRDQARQSFVPLCTHTATWCSFCTFLFLDHELHWLEPPGFFGSWWKSILELPKPADNWWCIHESPPGQASCPRHRDRRFPTHILSKSYPKFVLLFWDTFHLVPQIVQGTFVQTMHSHTQIGDLSWTHSQRTSRGTPANSWVAHGSELKASGHSSWPFLGVSGLQPPPSFPQLSLSPLAFGMPNYSACCLH